MKWSGLMESKFSALKTIYDEFETEARPFSENAACGKGCAYCCTNAGSIDITTLEGLRIHQYMQQLPRPNQNTLKKSLNKDAARHEKGQSSPCPFLLKNKSCRIYDIRPFACRRIYSLKTCGPDQPPLIHRQVMQIADTAIRRLQALDDTGYSGHIAYILHMLGTPKFLSTYLSGAHAPEAIMVYGKTHKIVINRMMTEKS